MNMEIICNKVCFKSRRSALKNVRNKHSRAGKTFGRIRAYFCDICRAHHITTQSRSGLKKEKRYKDHEW